MIEVNQQATHQTEKTHLTFAEKGADVGEAICGAVIVAATTVGAFYIDNAMMYGAIAFLGTVEACKIYDCVCCAGKRNKAKEKSSSH